MVAEELLHFIWQFRLFNQLELYSTDGEEINIQFVGELNRDAGPDFLYARVSVGTEHWTGHIELHVDGADWLRHQHHKDAAYNNVILHVVYENGITVFRKDGTQIPCLVLGRLVDRKLLVRYRDVMHNLHWIPCERHLPNISSLIKNQLLDRLAVERLEEQYTRIHATLEDTQGDWERVLFIHLSRSFGMKVNAETFMQFGRLVDLGVLRKYQKEPFKMEAMLFGQAGLIARSSADAYERSLQQEYNYLCRVHGLKAMVGFEWKFMRMRPANFPTFRLAQLIGLYGANPYLFQCLLACENVSEVLLLLADEKIGNYWEEHYRFGKKSDRHTLQLSKDFKQHLLINTFIPILFSFAKEMGLDHLQTRALEWLATTKAEDNAIVRAFHARGYDAVAASDSQALLVLKKNYCSKKRCLSCMIGHAIFKS
ncbi:DUF2851 family protein [Sphingobacterium griseoflavum]|uniref:DUF2851 domain-containing protein n=1 Tax=Sphingobacterium griseoflavum TaxID=1474952 RepID=A0ABQ3HV40_9SPHI|nr:DUF2851 family protein [Sphingobacterium griseoflavum]GHE30566.1 hypothetical protein GCM10017764_11860 [Sphingobacterium griseoflavum]